MSPTADTGRPAPSLANRKVLITGGNGFIARAVAERLGALGAEVVGLDLTADPTRGVVAGDVTKPEQWSAALDGVDTVIHTAALLGAAYSLDQSWHVNVLGTSRVLRASIDAGVRRFVHFSSVAAYGFDFPDDVDETYPVHVNGDVYTDTKVNSEAVVLAAHAAKEIDVTVIRPGDVWGPGSVWVRSPIAEMRKPTGFPLPDSGNGIFSPVYIDNFVDGLVLVIASDESVGQVFNIGDGVGVRCADFFGRLATMSGGTVRTLPMAVAAPLADAVGSVLRRLGQKTDLSAGTMWLLNRPGTYSIEKAQKMLGYRPLVSMDEGMERVAEWVRAEGLVGG
ncbi:NAD-dependent epimerase/dehydratase family protein [Mycolicibacterium celeriflavum]|uniref:Putative oxidoreductase n=1 Tax=Mycolicibacterium celeriflavum TaxID=1249101 RepID=A0A1X0C0D2_MYCCF|nr:NAD(P)-dependent oxidoreductase [Mycolicibacterium celeriflavum]MCV7238975.1 NAD(P)-dependent oxidoreductase [Mycolicibacterium celeriflavum]ORA50471.1 dehydrogenase [Mycolicibacterium celeriflavum]BBY45215.1 putative oxidoreductase [Mycolicibacterium celeriflavum]